MDTKKLNATESMRWKYVLECYLDSGPKNMSLENKRFKKWLLEVETLMENSSMYLTPSKL